MSDSKTKTHAEREIEILLKTTPDAIIRDFVPEILAICEAFGKSGQSGGSAPYTASALSQAIKKLCLQQAIAPLTGEDDEWMKISEHPSTFQNVRESAVFKDEKGAYYLDAIVWRNQNGATYTGSEYVGDKKILSRQYIKAFPFNPKTYTIDVIETEVSKDDWRFDVKNPDDLKAVFADESEYYESN